jgi:hypothetical protein
MAPLRKSLLVLLLLMAAVPSFAKKKKQGETEQGLISRLMGCLANKDPYCYISLWPDLDTLTKVAMMVSDSNSAEFRDAYMLQENPVRMMHADSLFKASLKEAFDTLIAQGEEYGIHWENTVLVRYELVKQRETRARLYEKIAPMRFVGYVFFVDVITRRGYGFMAGDILNINGGWWGGRIRDLYEANTRDEWDDARYYARKHRKAARTDSVKKSVAEQMATEEQQEINAKAPEVIADRKFYGGMFDNEIPVQLYLRSLKGGCPAGICSWEAIYKFGDQDDYVRLEVTHRDDGKWEMVEQLPSGTSGAMELELKDKIFTGTWTAADGQTGYDVKLSELEVTPKKIKRLDDIFAGMKGQK